MTNPTAENPPPDHHHLQTLLKKARNLPRTPGVYLMKDAHEHILYVGKAVNLPDRVSSYFLPSTDLGPRKQPMLQLITDFDFIECETEWEALLTENRLIKDTRPHFNTMQLDDKTFPYLVITIRDDFPGVYITRNPNDPEFKSAKILGPFTNVTALRDAIQLLQRVFKFLTFHLDIKGDEYESIMRLIQSNVDLSISRHLGPPDDDSSD